MAAPHLYRTEGVVLRRHDFGEADRIVTLYTAQHGKIRAVAKGVRRPTSKLGGHVELFVHAAVQLAKGRNLDIITQSETLDPYIGLRDDLWRASHAYCVAELLDRLTDERLESQPTFDLLIQTLDRLATARDPEIATRYFEVHLLDLLGYRPQLHECVRCRALLEPTDNAFSLTSGGVLCPICKDSDPGAWALSTNAFKVLRVAQSGDWALLSHLRLDVGLRHEIEQILRGYCQHVAEIQLKSPGFVEAIRSRPGALGQG